MGSVFLFLVISFIISLILGGLYILIFEVIGLRDLPNKFLELLKRIVNRNYNIAEEALFVKTVKNYFDSYIREEYSKKNNLNVRVSTYQELHYGKRVYTFEALVQYELSKTFHTELSKVIIGEDYDRKDAGMFTFLKSVIPEESINRLNDDNKFWRFLRENLDYHINLKWQKRYGIDNMYEVTYILPNDFKLLGTTTEEEVKDLSEEASNFADQIRCTIYEIKDLSKNLENMDISIAVSELSEDTDEILGLIGDTEDKKLKKLITPYRNSLESILESLQEMKDMDSDEDISKIVEKINNDVRKCSEFVESKREKAK